MKYKSYDNEILKAYSQMNKKAEKFIELEYHKHRPRQVPFSEHV